MVQVTESDYRTAQKGNAKVRREFVKAIDLEDAREFVNNVVYFPSVFDKRGVTFMSFVSASEPFKLDQFIAVHPESFNFCSYGEFLSTLIDHEGYHARQDIQKATEVNELHRLQKELPHHRYQKGEYFESLLELPAYANQIMRAEKRGLTHEEKLDLGFDYNLHETILKKSRIRKNKKRNFRKDISKILCDTDGDLFVRLNLRIN